MKYSMQSSPDGSASPTSEKPPFMYFHRVWILMLIGATWGAMLDYLHTHGGAISYPEGTNHWRGIATFAVVYGFTSSLYCALNKLIRDVPSVPFHWSIPSFLLFSALYAYTAYSTASTYWITFVILVVEAYFWYVFDGKFVQLLSDLGFGLCGAGMESFLSYQGTMSYTTQDIGMIPFWLIALYTLAACTFGQMSGRLLFTKNPWDPTDGAYPNSYWGLKSNKQK